MGWSNQDITLIILSEQASGFSGLFGYSPSPAAGNLIFSLAAAAGTDPYGNTYPAGLSTAAGNSTITGSNYVLNSSGLFFYSGTPAAGNMLISAAGSAGTDAYGNAYPAGLEVYGANATFGGTNYVINSDGVFFYSGTPAANNLAVSVTAANVTDAHGNLALAGFTTYVKSGVIYLAAQNSSAGVEWFEANSMAGPWGIFTAKITADQSGNLTIDGNSVVSFPTLINGNTVSWAFLGSIRQMTSTGNASKSGIGTISTNPNAAEFNALNTAYNNTVDTINNGILGKLRTDGFMA